MPPRKQAPVTIATSARPALDHRAHVDAWAARGKVLAAKKGAALVEEAVRARRATAGAAVKRFQRGVSALGHRVPEGASHDRLLRAGGAARVEVGTDRVVVYNDQGQPDVKRTEVLRIRLQDSPVERLAAKRQLCPLSAERNLALLQAARILQDDWLLAGLSTIGSVDLERDGAKGTAPALFRSEAQADAFHDYARAMSWLTIDQKRVISAIVLEEKEPATAGRLVSGYQNGNQSRAVGLYVLRLGLVRMATGYGLVALDDGVDAQGGRHELSEV